MWVYCKLCFYHQTGNDGFIERAGSIRLISECPVHAIGPPYLTRTRVGIRVHIRLKTRLTKRTGNADVFLLPIFSCFLGPEKPQLAWRTVASITVDVTSPFGNPQDLLYKLRVVGDGFDPARGHCTDTSCTISALKHGRSYDISVQACIKTDQTNCGDFSATASIYTVPNGRSTIKR